MRRRRRTVSLTTVAHMIKRNLEMWRSKGSSRHSMLCYYVKSLQLLASFQSKNKTKYAPDPGMFTLNKEFLGLRNTCKFLKFGVFKRLRCAASHNTAKAEQHEISAFQSVTGSHSLKQNKSARTNFYAAPFDTLECV